MILFLFFCCFLDQNVLQMSLSFFGYPSPRPSPRSREMLEPTLLRPRQQAFWRDPVFREREFPLTTVSQEVSKVWLAGVLPQAAPHFVDTFLQYFEPFEELIF